MLERLEKLLKEAQKHIGWHEEFLLEAKINAEFNPTAWNLKVVESKKSQLAEKVNFANVLDAKIHELKTGEKTNLQALEVTAETVKSSLQI